MSIKYDPKLKEAMAKISGILDEYDIGASIALCSKSHSEFLYHFPKWSLAQFNEKKDGVRIKAKSSNNDQSALEVTTHLICQIRDIAIQTYGAYEGIIKELEKHIEIDHKSYSNFSPHFES